jgi:hypothetical protein
MPFNITLNLKLVQGGKMQEIPLGLYRGSLTRFKTIFILAED